jgi:hypothetical protein
MKNFGYDASKDEDEDEEEDSDRATGFLLGSVYANVAGPKPEILTVHVPRVPQGIGIEVHPLGFRVCALPTPVPNDFPDLIVTDVVTHVNGVPLVQGLTPPGAMGRLRPPFACVVRRVKKRKAPKGDAASGAVLAGGLGVAGAAALGAAVAASGSTMDEDPTVDDAAQHAAMTVSDAAQYIAGTVAAAAECVTS